MANGGAGVQWARRVVSCTAGLAMAAAAVVGVAPPAGAAAAGFTSPSFVVTAAAVPLVAQTPCPEQAPGSPSTVTVTITDTAGATSLYARSFPTDGAGMWSVSATAPLRPVNAVVHVSCFAGGSSPTLTYQPAPLTVVSGSGGFSPGLGSLIVAWRIPASSTFKVTASTPCPAPPAGIIVTGTTATVLVLNSTKTKYLQQDSLATPDATGAWSKVLSSPSEPNEGSSTFYVAAVCKWGLPDGGAPLVSLDYHDSRFTLVMVPATTTTTAAGAVLIRATTATNTVRTASVSSTPAAVTVAAADQSTLPATGRNTGVLGLLGMMLVATGGVTMRAAKERWDASPWDIFPPARRRLTPWR
jgi:LPXTG-motif cell wall-anchored protein